MNPIRRTLLAAALMLVVTSFLAAPSLHAQATGSAITKQMAKLRSLSAQQRPPATVQLAADITALPAGPKKVELANNLANLVTEGDQGAATVQAVADALSKALAESPVPAKPNPAKIAPPPAPYMELARLVRYENVSTPLNDPLLDKARQALVDNDADVQKADFTLKDLNGKKYTLSELRGKIVMVNFWATWCPPCRAEMPDLDWLYTHFQSQGLIVLSITGEDSFTVGPFITNHPYHPPVLIDMGGQVAKQFHVDGIPKTFIFNRDGKLLAQTIDECTQRQFLDLLGKTDLHN
jgi:peroxiredoxin